MARPRQVTDAEILRQARLCFLEHGPSVSTTTIAQQLGVSQAALFKRFHTKEELLLAALIPALMDLAAIEAGPHEGPIPEQLLDHAEAIFTHLLEVVPCISILRAAGVDVKRCAPSGQINPRVRLQQAISGWIARAQDQGRLRPADPLTVANLLLASIHLRAFSQHMDPDMNSPEDPRAYMREVVELLWSGVAPEVTP